MNRKCDAWGAPVGRVPALEELDMTAPLRDPELAKKLAEEMRKRIAERIKPYSRTRCLNGRGCPMCWGR